MKTKYLYSILCAGVLSSAAHAGNTIENLNNCGSGIVTVNTVKIAATDAVVSNSPVNFAACYGGVTSNDKPDPVTNLGYFNDGILNGQPVATGKKDGLDVFGDGAFLSGNYTASKLNPTGEGNDPGWVYLGKDDSPGGDDSFAPADVGDVAGITLASWFSIKQITDSQGNSIWEWSFTPDADVVSRASELFGDNYFDQFALVFKQGDAFAVYNFTGEQFGVPHPKATDPILNFYGTADVSSVFNDSTDLSHVSVWARDPGATNDVPEPGTLALLGLGIIGFALARKR